MNIQLMVKIVVLILIIIYGMDASVTEKNIQEFLVDNGHHHVDIFYNSSLWHRFTLPNMFSARIHLRKIKKAKHNSFGIFLFDPQRDDLLGYLNLIIQRRIKMSLIITRRPLGNDGNILLQEYLSNLEATSLFYMVFPATISTVMTWHQIVSLRSGSAINPLAFKQNTLRIIETFDMHGVEITATSLTWAPYLTIDDCNEFGKECAINSGYMIDFMDKLADIYNFTYVSQKNVENDWGDLPISGAVGTNGTNGGIWGDIISKHYDMSLNMWTWTLERNELFSFVPTLQTNNVLVVKPQQSSIDFGFFTRALTVDSFSAILLLNIATLSLIFIFNFYGLDEEMNGVKMMTFISWMFFTLINSYYSGVLTMFFATTSAPFETFREAVLSYPNWIIIIQDGSQGWISQEAEKGDPDFLSLWQRYQENPAEMTYYSIREGLELVESRPNIMYADKNKILAHLKSKPTKQPLHMISIGESKYNSILFYKNSPLLPLFKQGASYLRETGLERQLFIKWFGEWSEVNVSPASSEATILTLGQMVLIFAMMLAMFSIVLVMLFGEITFKRIFKKVIIHW